MRATTGLDAICTKKKKKNDSKQRLNLTLTMINDHLIKCVNLRKILFIDVTPSGYIAVLTKTSHTYKI